MNQVIHPLLRVLRSPDRLLEMSADDQDQVLRLARRNGLLGRLAILMRPAQRWNPLSEKVRDILEGAHIEADEHLRRLRWEVGRLERALHGMEIPVVLLKGAAFAMAKLPAARGRLVADVDLLVAEAHMPMVEQALLKSGWAHMKTDAYDQQYYREWMHEIPPLRHRERDSEVDLHRNILPLTSRLSPSAEALLSETHSIPGGETRFLALSPVDMTLHAAAHLFYDGDFGKGLRELVDLNDLMRYFGRTPSYWQALTPRAVELELTRPLYYALRHVRRLFNTPIPISVMESAEQHGAPMLPIRLTMDLLIHLAVDPNEAGPPGWSEQSARFLLYIRAHWLRMPPLMLGKHLWRKWRMGRQNHVRS
ncbi:MAG: nucleotidyltransferase family protein [Magnetococcales bacterium]|nr:nucleotidyltransferase family protein [Magnetococcales bacterium]